MEPRKHISDATGSRTDKPWKATLFEGRHLFLGVNALAPGQGQAAHSHADQDKFFMVSSGHGHFTIGDRVVEGRAGDVIFMPAGIPHAVENRSAEPLVLLMGITQAQHHHDH